jgi:hypothetical protein
MKNPPILNGGFSQTKYSTNQPPIENIYTDFLIITVYGAKLPVEIYKKVNFNLSAIVFTHYLFKWFV